MKRIARKICLVFLLFFLSKGAGAQFGETLFYDTVTKVSGDGYVQSSIADGKYIYVSGASFSQTSPLPTVIKMDTSGTVIWTASDETNYGRFGGYGGFENTMAACRGTIKAGDRIYTIAEPHNYQIVSTRLHEVWCISDADGMLLWKVNINNSPVIKITDYSDTSLLAITRTSDISNSFIGIYIYHIINKTTGAVIFSKHFGNAGVSIANDANIFVDSHKNILLSWDDTCRKFRDDRLSQLAWTSHIPYNGSLKMIDVVMQDSNRYFFSGRNNVRCVDTLTGATVWFKSWPSVGFIAGVQSGGECSPTDFFFRDSLLFLTWSSDYVGATGLDRAFVLTRLNKYNGFERYTVAHGFTGAPPVLINETDWPFKMCMDENRNIYMVGSYDRAPGIESPGNWGIMRINSETGAKVYEATISDDLTSRSTKSQAKFVYYLSGKLYATGNLQKLSDPQYARPVLLSFDTSIVFHERYRKGVEATIRYPSSLKSILPFSSSKMALLKKTGRSAVIELRTADNQPIWSQTFNSSNKFMVPQNMITLADTGIAASFILYQENSTAKILPEKADSLVFVRLDTLGNIKFIHRIRYNNNDSLTAVQVYKDNQGKINFIYRRKNATVYSYAGYMLGGASASVSALGSNVSYDPDTTVVRINPLENYNLDTTVLYQTATTLSSRGWLQSNMQTTSYAFHGQRIVRSFARIYSSLKLDAESFFVMGRDSSGQLSAARYNHRLSNPLVWSYNSGVNGTMYNADSSAQFLYTVGMSIPAKKMLINKIDKTTGTASWNFERSPQPKTALLPADLKYDMLSRQFTAGGYITDSSRRGIGESYFYITLDSSGTVLKDIVRQGFGLGETRINAVNTLPNGGAMYGGSMSISALGTVGFYNSDCRISSLIPSVSIAGVTLVNPGQSVFITAAPVNGGTAPAYQWQDSTSTHSWQLIAGATGNSIHYTPALTGDKIRCLMASNINCGNAVPATSNALIFTVNTPTAIGTVPASGYGIICYPNPARNMLYIDSLNLSHQWETLEIHSFDGKRVMGAINVKNKKTVAINISRLPAGYYVATLIRRNKQPGYLKFQKL